MKVKIKAALSKQDLSCITIDKKNKNELRWLNENEFFYKGKLYDVILKHKNLSQSIIYDCLTDEQEEKCFEKLDQETNNAMNNNSSNNKLLQKIVAVADMIKTINNDYCFFNNKKVKTRFITEVPDKYGKPCLNKLSPPPKISS